MGKRTAKKKEREQVGENQNLPSVCGPLIWQAEEDVAQTTPQVGRSVTGQVHTRRVKMQLSDSWFPLGA